MTIKQQIEFEIERWMKTKDPRRKKLVLLWSEDIPELAEFILQGIDFDKYLEADKRVMK